MSGAAVLAVAVAASTVGVLASPAAAAPVRPVQAPAATEPPAAGPGITDTAEGEVDQGAPLPEDLAKAAAPDSLVPGTVRVAPDRSPFRTVEPLATPLDSTKTRGVWGPNPELTVGSERVGDVNADGIDDLVTAIGLNYAGTLRSYLAVMLGIGDGTYTDPIFSLGAPTGGANGTTPYDMALADVDGDTNLDVILSSTNYSTGVLSLMLGVGDGSFAAPIGSLAVANPGYLRVGNWGGTADVQIAITGANATIHVLDVNPEGFDDLTPAGVGWLNSNRQLNAMEAADVDEDGQSELYLAMDNGTTDAEGVQRLTDLTSATPSITWVEGVKPGVYRMAFADVDGDDNLDLTVTERRNAGYANQYWLRTVALPGRDPGADPFPTGVQVHASESYCPGRVDAGRLLSADMDHDGDLDLVMLNCQWGELNYIRVALNDGHGAFTLSHWIATPGENGSGPVSALNREPRGVAIVDADGDDLPDVAWTGTNAGVANGVTVVLGSIGHPGELVAPPLLDVGGRLTRDQSWNAQQVLIADWDEDGTPDLVIERDDDIAWRKGDGTGRFGPPAVISSRTGSTWCPAGPGELGVFDLDDDGHLDLVCHTPGKVAMAWGGGEGVTVVATPLNDVPSYANWTGFHGIDAPDLDGNGKLDLVIPVFSNDFDTGSFGYVWFQGADRAWPTTPAVAEMGSATTFAVGNVDSDPEPELVAMPDRRREGGSGTANIFAHVISWSADGSGGLTEHVSAATTNRGIGSLPGSIDNGHGLGDFDGDGILDLVTVWYYGNPYYQQYTLVRKGLGNGEFAAEGDHYASSMNWAGGSYQRAGSSIGVRDMDGDGNLDIVYESTAYGVEILPGKGDGTFDDQKLGRWPAGSNNGTIAVGDIDGDHKPDIIAGNNLNQSEGPQLTHTLLLNRSVPNADAPPNLAVTDVSAPSSVGAGDQVSVEVTVTNSGGDISTGTTWKDGAWLSEAAGYSLAATEIEVTPHQGPLAAGASYTVTLTGPARAFRAGSHHLVVRTDLARQVTEPDEADNDTDRPITVDVPVLTPGGPAVETTVASGASRLVRIPAVGGRTVSITATPATATAIRGRAGPDRAPNLGGGTALKATGTGPLVGSLSRGTNGDLYAVIEGLSAAGSGTDVELVADDAPVGLFTSSPGRVSNGGDVTLTITGAGLDDAAMQLKPASGASGGAVDATKVIAGGTPGTWFATFALDAQLGTFDLKASGPGGDALLPGAVVVEAPVITPNAREFEVAASVPARIRRHVTGPGGVEIRPGYNGTVVVRNRTGRDLPAPFIRIEATGLQVTWPDVAGGKRTVPVDAEPADVGVLTMLGTVPGGPVDTIPARATVTIDFRLWATAPDDFSVDVGLWAASDQTGELDYGPEATTIASVNGLPSSAAPAITAALEQATTHPTRPTYPGASASGPWPTPGGYTRALDAMAATMAAAGRPVGSVEELRSLVVAGALAHADVGAPISGHVLQGGTNPDEPLEMWAAPVDGTGPTLTGSAATDGTFNLLPAAGDPSLSAEDYQVFVDGRVESPAATVAVTPGTPVADVDVDVAVGRIATGRITRAADGAPVRGAQVALVPVSIDGAPSVAAETGTDGRFRATGLKDGTYRVSIRAAGLATLADEEITVSGAAVTIDRALAVGNDLTGTITAAGGGGAAAKVTAYAESSPGSTTAIAAVDSEADGTYRLADLPAGPVTVVARASNGDAASSDLTITGDTTKDLALLAAVDVTGTVVSDRTGDPVEGATVQLLTSLTGDAPHQATSSGDGTFTVTGVAPVPASLVASAPDVGSSGAVLVDLAASHTGLELHLGSGRHITGTVTSAGSPVGGVVVEAAAPEGRDVGDGTLVRDGGRGVTGADGRYDLIVPAAGDYAITVLDASASTSVVDGQPDPVVDLAVAAVAVSGTVRDGGGAPVADAGVHLLVGGDEASTVTTGHDGTYSMVVTGGTEASIWVADDAVGVAHHDVTVPASGSVTVPDLVPGADQVQVELSTDASPIAGDVQVRPVPAGASAPAAFGISVPVDGDGQVTIDGLDAGDYALSGAAPGRATTHVDAAVPGGAPVTIDLPVEVPFSSTIVDQDGAAIAGAQVDVVASDGGPGGGTTGTADDGTFAVGGLAPGTYDVWVTPFRKTSLRVASGIVLDAPALARASSARPDGATTLEVPSQFNWYPATGSDAIYGHITGPNGVGLGPNPPEVVARIGDREIPIEVGADGNISLYDPPAGPVVIEVRKDGHETTRYPLSYPQDKGTVHEFRVGFPVDSKDKLNVDVDPPSPLPSVAEAFAALFDFVDPEPRAVDPFMFTILAAEEADNPCPNGNALLARAKRKAQLAINQTEVTNALLEERYAEKWRRGWLFTVQMLDSAGALVSAALPVAKAVKGGVYVVTEAARTAGEAVPELLVLLDQLREVPITSMVQNMTGLITGAIINGSVDFDAATFAFISTMDLARYALESQRNVLLATANPNRIPALPKLVRGAGIALASLLDVVYAFNKAKDALDQLKLALQQVRDLEVSATQASDLANRLEQEAKRAYALWLSQANGRTDCDQPKDLPGYAGGVGGAVDPNEIVGPTGQGADRWLAVPAGLGYEVHFENLGPGTVNPPPGVPLATSPAAEVVVRETVPSTYDRSSFTFDDVGWGTHAIDVPDGVQSFTADEPITVEVDDVPVDLVVRVSGDYDPGTGKATWRYRTLDPETGDIPLDPAEGFLPPEPGDETGQGWLRYSVSGAEGVAQGTYLDAAASITFDTNEPIDTNTWRNRVGTPGSTGEVCPADDSANGRFLCAAYQDLLGRTPDAAGKAHWLARLTAGTARSSVASSLLASTEGRRTAVRAIFDDYLGRAPDPSGLSYWVTTMGSGATQDSVRRSVLASSEYYRRHGSTRAGYVSGLYDDVYGRPADPAGKTYWTQSLAGGRSRASLAGVFLMAPEGRRAIVRDVYDDYLGRTLTFAEASYWATRLLSQNDERRFRSEVIGSPEYFSHA